MEFWTFVILFGLVLIFSMTSRGWLGETHTKISLWLALDSDIYQKVHDAIVPSTNGTTQIDHLLISPFGVFIVETKNMKGWIFGSTGQSTWMQVVYNNKYPFQNPNRQTFRQKRILSEYLGLDEDLIFPIIYFVGNCRFKTEMPPNVIKNGLGSFIKRYQKRIISPEEIARILVALNKLASDSSLTRKNHIRSLHERHNSTTTCPRCGSKLIERTARQGSSVGSKFLGCEKYPRCRFTKDQD